MSEDGDGGGGFEDLESSKDDVLSELVDASRYRSYVACGGIRYCHPTFTRRRLGVASGRRLG